MIFLNRRRFVAGTAASALAAPFVRLLSPPALPQTELGLPNACWCSSRRTAPSTSTGDPAVERPTFPSSRGP